LRIPQGSIFRVLAAVFAIAALQHLARALGAGADNPPGRHLVFVAVNALVAAGLWRRPPFFAWAFAALALQQLMSHGGDLARAWSSERRIDWLSLVVLAVVITTAVLLLRERHGGLAGAAARERRRPENQR
jgi:hypothetical protein